MITYMREIFSKINSRGVNVQANVRVDASHKLRDKSGETLVETLVALIITTLALMMLPGAVVAAARVNARISDQVIYMERTDDAAAGVDAGKCDITFSTSDMKKSTVNGVQVTRFGNDKTGLYEIGLLQE
ncbi:MAG: hypothetical protein E7281_02835 [Lachnospiraceae bacterium]|nr:hypothetical protein [Lachnospiraceae bacterium]